MKKIIILLIVFSLLLTAFIGCAKKSGPTGPDPTPGAATFDNVLNVPAAGMCVIQANDSGYMIAGYSNFNADRDVYLLKVDSDGNCVWSKTFGGANDDKAEAVIKVSDGYVIVGETKSFGDVNGDVYIVKTDFSGGLSWQNNIGGGATYDSGYGVRQTADGGYIITGRTEIGPGNYDMYLLKTDSGGNYSWDNSFGGNSYDYGDDILVVPGGYFIAGYSSSFSSNHDVYTVVTDVNGNCTAAKTVTGLGADTVYSVVQGIDNGYVMAGETWPVAAGVNDVYLVKVDSDGDCVFAKTLGGSGNEYAITLISDGTGYVMTGITSSYGTRN